MPTILCHYQTKEVLIHGPNDLKETLFEAFQRRIALDGVDLQGQDLSNVAIRSGSMYAAHLRGANLQGAWLTEIRLAGADAQAVDFRGAHFCSVNCAGIQAVRASFAEARLSMVGFGGAKLPRTTFENAFINDVDFSGARLAEANFSGTRFFNVNFQGADLSDTCFRGAHFDGEPIHIAPLTVCGLTWPVTITPMRMRIGCKLYTHENWASLDDDAITGLESTGRALGFWREYGSYLLALCAKQRELDEFRRLAYEG